MFPDPISETSNGVSQLFFLLCWQPLLGTINNLLTGLETHQPESVKTVINDNNAQSFAKTLLTQVPHYETLQYWVVFRVMLHASVIPCLILTALTHGAFPPTLSHTQIPELHPFNPSLTVWDTAMGPGPSRTTFQFFFPPHPPLSGCLIHFNAFSGLFTANRVGVDVFTKQNRHAFNVCADSKCQQHASYHHSSSRGRCKVYSTFSSYPALSFHL